MNTFKNVIFISDIHAESTTPEGRRDNVFSAFQAKFDFLIDYAIENQSLIIQAGDLTNKPRDWKVMNYLSAALGKLKENNLAFVSLYGQHDLYMRNIGGDSIFNALQYGGLISNLSNKEFYFNMYAKKSLIKCCAIGITLYDEKDIAEKISSLYFSENELKKIDRIFLVIHGPIGLNDKERSMYDLFGFGKILKHRLDLKIYQKLSLILLGDIHEAFNSNSFIINTGPMMRLRRVPSEMQHQPHFYTYDRNKLRRVDIPSDNVDNIFNDQIDSDIKARKSDQMQELYDELSSGNLGELSVELISEAVASGLKKVVKEKMIHYFTEFDIITKGK